MRKILVVDDTYSELIKEIFLDDMGFNKKNGYEVDLCLDGFTAPNLVRNNDYFFILMDGHLGDMSGPDAVLEIRKFNRNVPIIMISDDKTMNDLGMKMGADGVMKKGSLADDANYLGGETFKELLNTIGVKLDK